MTMTNTIRLTEAKSKMYNGTFQYLIAYDYSAGRNNVYNVFVLNAGDPVTIGRELPVGFIRDLIREYEKEAENIYFTGERSEVIRVHETVIRMRNKRKSCQK